VRATLAGAAGPSVETRRTFDVSSTSSGTTLTGKTRFNGIPQDTSDLAILFPDLPDASVPGSTRAWNIEAPRARDVREAERTRAGHTAPAKTLADGFAIPLEPIIASVRLDGWLTIRGARAASLTMDGIQRLETRLGHIAGGPQSAKQDVTAGAATLRGIYVMLASGRLLHATIARSSVVAKGQATQLTTTQEESIEARLVGACDGPTEPPFDAP